MEKNLTTSALSTAAQAVWGAWEKSPVSLDVEGADRNALAAALRTAAEKIEDLYCDSDIDDSEGVVFALRQLMLIANELEGA
jgi:hypothetical protein